MMPLDPTASVPLCLVSVSSSAMNEEELYDIAHFELRNRLQSIRGVIDMTRSGWHACAHTCRVEGWR
jgi:multidrug efflux pump subunit AcrB